MTVMLMLAALSVAISIFAAVGVVPVWAGSFFAIMAIIFVAAFILLKLQK